MRGNGNRHRDSAVLLFKLLYDVPDCGHAEPFIAKPSDVLGDLMIIRFRDPAGDACLRIGVPAKGDGVPDRTLVVRRFEKRPDCGRHAVRRAAVKNVRLSQKRNGLR